MDRKESVIKKLKEFKNITSKKIDLDKVIFFGSRVKGKARRYSDIDLVIVSKEFRGLKFRRRPLLLDNYWDLDYPVDFLCYTPEEFKKLSKQITIVKEAVKEGIEI
ncbi:nucleotidyltransferase domain-containing protein [Candidatus Woesearchaeota archaeon]|nr:nucleotidyltransferase domain-containing protein [Candidatus Woesearchaeota archaeon]